MEKIYRKNLYNLFNLSNPGSDKNNLANLENLAKISVQTTKKFGNLKNNTHRIK